MKKTFQQVLAVTRFNFSHWKGEPRIILTFALAFILCFLLTDKAMDFAESNGTILQLFEPFVWSFGDSDSILLSSLLLVLLFADLPYLSSATPYYLVRMDRKVWLMGQSLYVVIGTLCYMVFLLVSTSLICMQQSYLGNLWSETAAILGYSGAGKQVALPALVRTLEQSDPYSCTMTIFLLMLCYSLLLMSIYLFAQLKAGQVGGIVSVFAVSLYGFLLSPKWIQTVFQITEEELYRANVLVGWLSPLNHSAYHMHNFGYDLLPKLGHSYVLFLMFILLFQWLSLRAIRCYSFHFTGGGEQK